MKALWFGKTSPFICGASRIAITFAMILAKEWIKLNGRKSLIESAPSFFDIKTMFAELRIVRLDVCRWWNALAALKMSSLMMPQQALKKEPVKPSGPGALSDGSCLIALWISSLVKGASRPLSHGLEFGVPPNWDHVGVGWSVHDISEVLMSYGCLFLMVNSPAMAIP